MIINYIAEPSYTKTVWFKETLNGIKEKSNSLRYSLNQIEATNISNNINILMIIGTSMSWVSKILENCNKYDITPIVVSCHPINNSNNSNYVLINHDAATKECIEYLKQCGKQNIALYGVNSDSYADNIKVNYFEKENIYYIKNNLSACFDEFIKNNKYDAVICTNYISAIHLINKLKDKDIKVPDDMYVVAYGDSVLGKKIAPSLTTITLDHKSLGYQAVQLYRYIYKNTTRVAVTVSLPCKIIPAESTENKDCKKLNTNYSYEDFDSFSNDNDILEIQSLEKFLRVADHIDFMIIDSMLKKESLSKMSDKLYVSESSIKYRIKKLLSISGFDTFSKLIEAYERYL